ncbi:MAG: hypothetical protein U0797_27650 [Gemmataceae bacterium]
MFRPIEVLSLAAGLCLAWTSAAQADQAMGNQPMGNPSSQGQPGMLPQGLPGLPGMLQRQPGMPPRQPSMQPTGPRQPGGQLLPGLQFLNQGLRQSGRYYPFVDMADLSPQLFNQAPRLVRGPWPQTLARGDVPVMSAASQPRPQDWHQYLKARQAFGGRPAAPPTWPLSDAWKQYWTRFNLPGSPQELTYETWKRLRPVGAVKPFVPKDRPRQQRPSPRPPFEQIKLSRATATF